MRTTNILGESSWELHSDLVSAGLTELGGHLGPVEFEMAGGRRVRPFHVAPWAGTAEAREMLPVLRVLRGDFFCMPFGGNERAWRGEAHPVHGETANEQWSAAGYLARGPWATLRAELTSNIRPARIEKLVRLRAGHRAVYCRHILSGATGPMCYGHHAMLNFGGGRGRISCARFVRGQVFPRPFENPAQGGYSCLEPGARFETLAKVPLAGGGFADLTHYPAREGFEDLVMVSADPTSDFGWSAAVFVDEGYVWFTLKDPRQLASTVLWHSNGGRHYPPWNGRHRAVLGIEEVTACFHAGLAESAAPNVVSRDGIPTAVRLHPNHPHTVSVIMGVAAIPKGFDIVATIRPVEGGIEIRSKSRKAILATIDLDFLYGAEEG